MERINTSTVTSEVETTVVASSSQWDEIGWFMVKYKI